jgi:glycosyltransferase involved in cell wall biosynthesis
VIIFFAVSYAILILLLWLGFISMQEVSMKNDNIPSRFLSVVIPFRNEAGRLAELVSSLENQSYPTSLFEVIFVNDHSVDNSVSIIERACENNSNFRLLHIDKDRNGKKASVSLGVENASGTHIIQTDADCTFGPQFIEAHGWKIDNSGAEFISGPVSYKWRQNSFLDQMETIDFLSLAGTGAGSFFYGNPIMCSGANLSYSKAFYQDAKHFDRREITPSGDDMFMLIAAKRLKVSTSWLKSVKAVVYTHPTGSLKRFLQQRIRWGSKAKYYIDRDILWIALLVALTNIVLLLSPIFIGLWKELWIIVLAGFGLKLIVDFLLLRSVTKFLNQSALLRLYLPVALLYYIYFVCVAVASLFGGIHWKGRVYKT